MNNAKAEKAKKKRRRSTKGSEESTGTNGPPMAASSSNSVPASSQHVPQHVPPPAPTVYPSSGSNVFQFPGISDYPGPSPVFMNPPGLQVDISNKLDFILHKLSKLDLIESQQKEIVSRLSVIEADLSVNKRHINETRTKIQDVEESQRFLSDKYESVSNQSAAQKGLLDKMESELKSMSERNSKLQETNYSMEEDLLDLQCRSMRDNLVFLGIPEGAESSQRPVVMETAGPVPASYAQAAAAPAPGEDCVSKIHDFCASVLKIENPRENLRIDRAHRMGGSATASKIRPIVVKFLDTDSKMRVKGALRAVDLRDTAYNVFDQLPQKVQERRKSLIPVMKKARSEGKRAYLVRDKLYINNRLYKPGSD